MNNPLKELITASKEVLKTNRSKSVFVYLTLIIFLVFAFLPAFLIPGNDLRFQASLLRTRDFLTIIPISAATALMIQMQIYLFKKTKTMQARAKVIGSGGVGTYSAVFGGLLATAACSSCIAAFFGFLGAGSVLFIVSNNVWFIVGALTLMLGSLHLASVRVNGHCAVCEIEPSEIGKE